MKPPPKRNGDWKRSVILFPKTDLEEQIWREEVEVIAFLAKTNVTIAARDAARKALESPRELSEIVVETSDGGGK